MNHPRHISIRDYSYDLPEDRIARYPLQQRDASRLLVYDQGRITESTYQNLAGYLPPGSLLVLNDTRVVEARLLFKKPTGGVVEIFCLEPGQGYADISSALRQQGKVNWKCLVGGASKWKPGQVLEKKFEPGGIKLTARYADKIPEAFLVELAWTPAVMSFSELLHQAGVVPLPPYLKREAESADAERYQTIFAGAEGSVAAPTAGLHITPHIMDELSKKNIRTAFVTLHVGAGTFKPVKSATIGEHAMHTEWIDVKKETIRDLIDHLENHVAAVGTTSLRTVESLHWLGVKIARGLMNDIEPLGQWEAYDLAHHNIPPKQSLTALLDFMEKTGRKNLVTQTGILIAPGYEFQIVKTLVTNFHQPQSTLLLLIAAFIGHAWKDVYAYALDHGFRFLSYGDGCLLRMDHRS
jgi:S-adenosylmethionine:tRNA ribosyltransferase-isomerase